MRVCLRSCVRYSVSVSMFACVRVRACVRVCVCVPLSKQQRGLGLGLVEGGGRAADDHGGPAVPPQGVLQDPGHLTVPVRDVVLGGREPGGEAQCAESTRGTIEP